MSNKNSNFYLIKAVDNNISREDFSVFLIIPETVKWRSSTAKLRKIKVPDRGHQAENLEEKRYIHCNVIRGFILKNVEISLSLEKP